MIACDGPSCSSQVVTVENKVTPARAEAIRAGWHKVGDPTVRSLDFCSQGCETKHLLSSPDLTPAALASLIGDARVVFWMCSQHHPNVKWETNDDGTMTPHCLDCDEIGPAR